MPIGLHLFLMILTMIAGFFSIPLLGMAWEDEFVQPVGPLGFYTRCCSSGVCLGRYCCSA